MRAPHSFLYKHFLTLRYEKNLHDDVANMKLGSSLGNGFAGWLIFSSGKQMDFGSTPIFFLFEKLLLYLRTLSRDFAHLI